jgi:1-acyl-sn-glycerol-3-phosphate acyltransferase
MRFFYIYRVVQFLKILIQAGLWLFCHKIHLKNKQLFTTKGPLLIIANHPEAIKTIAWRTHLEPPEPVTPPPARSQNTDWK